MRADHVMHADGASTSSSRPPTPLPALARPATNVAPATNPAPGEAGRVRQVAQEFEAMMLTQMLASMRQAAGKTSMGARGQNLYQQMMDDELGRVLAKGGGLGLTDALVRDLLNQVVDPKKSSSLPQDRSIRTADGGNEPSRREGGAR